MLISVIHPAARPARLARIVRQWFERADKPNFVQYTIGFHNEQAPDFEEFLAATIRPARSCSYVVNGGPDHPTLNGRSSFVGNANLAATQTAGAVICLATDDLEPPEHWDTAIKELLTGAWRNKYANGQTRVAVPRQALADACRADLEAILHCGTGNPARDPSGLILHPIMTRRRYERQSWFFCPCYSGMYADNDLTERAERDGIILDARKDLDFKHTHPLYGTAETDQVYAWQNAPAEYARGRAIFEKRKAAGFPIGPHWDEIGDLTAALPVEE